MKFLRLIFLDLCEEAFGTDEEEAPRPTAGTGGDEGGEGDADEEWQDDGGGGTGKRGGGTAPR